MGADIHVILEVRDVATGKWELANIPWEIGKQYDFPFGTRDYSIFGFLANVRNYAKCPYLDDPRGLPEDSEYLNQANQTSSLYSKRFVSNKDDLEDDGSYHSFSHFTLSELLACDYDARFENLRQSTVMRTADTVSYRAGGQAKPGEGTWMTVQEHLGESYFAQLELLRTFGEPYNVRLIFYFDS